MSYNKKIIIAIFLLVTIVVIFIFSKILTIKFEYLPLRFNNVECMIPSHLESHPYSEKQWEGINAFNRSKTNWIYIVKKTHEKSAALENYFDKNPKIKTLGLNDNLVFGIHVSGKNYRRYIYIFLHQNHAFWIESGTSTSSLLLIKHIADKIMTSLKIDGKKPISELESITKKTTAFVSPRYSQSFKFFIFILIGVLLLTYVIIIVIFYFSNKEPKTFVEHPLRYYKGITFKISFQPLGMQMYDGIVVSTGKELHLYTFKKLIARIIFENLTDISNIKVGRTLLLKQDYLSFFFPEPIQVKIPGRRKSQKAKKITIYLNIDKIQQLLLETSFPFKHQLIQQNYR